MSLLYARLLGKLGGAATVEVWLNFIASVIASLAWPVAIIVVASIFRRHIFQLLGRIRKASYGDAEVEFDKQLDETEPKVAELETAQPHADNPPEESVDNEFEKSAKQSPRLAVLNDWIKIEEAITSLAEAKGYTGPRAKSFSFAFRNLSRDGAISPDLHEVIAELRSLRNIAIHARSELEVSFDEAQRFHDMASVVTRRIASLM